MGNSEQLKAALELGKLLVKELDLERSVDTLSRWMAFYLANKIKEAESLPNGTKKRNAEKECFSLVLDLWRHRWNYKPDRQPLKDFKRLFEVLDRLDPENEQAFYFRWQESEVEEKGIETSDISLSLNLSAIALHLDKTTRIWISWLLHQSAAKAKSATVNELISRAAELQDSIDVKIIEFLFDDAGNDEDKNEDQLRNETNRRVKALERRIFDLKKFKTINEYLLQKFEDELESLQKSGNPKNDTADQH